MVNLRAAADEVVGSLTDLGIRATLDPRDANPPCVVVREAEITPGLLDGWRVTWQLDLIAGDAGSGPTSTTLSDLFSKVTDALPIDSATRVDLLLPGAPDPTPAYRLLLSSSVH